MARRIRIEWTQPARTEALEATAWYAEQSDAIAENFLGMLDSVMEMLRRFPEAGFAAADGTRSVPVPDFPYRAHYLLRDDVLRVLALAHARREPGYWRRRPE